MSQKFEPSGSPRQIRTEGRLVELVAPLVDGGEMRWEGQFAAEKLVEYEALIVRGGLEGWEIVHELLGDDWGAPSRNMLIFVDGKMVAAVPHNRPRRRR